MTDYKEFAKQMRENAVKNEQGNIVCSPELWEEIASVIEKGIIPPCKVGTKVWLINNPREYEVLNFHWTGQILWATLILIKEPTITRDINTEQFGKTVFLTKEEAEQKLKELGK